MADRRRDGISRAVLVPILPAANAACAFESVSSRTTRPSSVLNLSDFFTETPSHRAQITKDALSLLLSLTTRGQAGLAELHVAKVNEAKDEEEEPCLVHVPDARFPRCRRAASNGEWRRQEAVGDRRPNAAASSDDGEALSSRAENGDWRLQTGDWRIERQTEISDPQNGDWRLQTGDWRIEPQTEISDPQNGDWRLETGDWRVAPQGTGR